jgi:hypothetical protein
MGVSAGTMMMASAVVSSIGTIRQIGYIKAANARERARYEREAQMAEIEAIEQENIRKDTLNQTLANNLAYQGASGYYDDSRSFMNINERAKVKAEKDIANIRMMGQHVGLKYREKIFENDLSTKSTVFGGYVSAITGLTTGYAQYKWHKTDTKIT